MAYTTIDKPTDYFNTVLYTGNNNTNVITGVGHQPDFIWFKKRNASADHILFDSVRGVTKGIFSSRTSAEETESGNRGLRSFDTDGFTLGPEVTQMAGSCNDNNDTFASWNWKAGTSVSGTTTGSGTGKAYSGSVNTDAGFSIITYLGNGSAGHSIPHHLGVTPEIIITKRRSNNGEWYVYSPFMGNTKHMRLNRTGGEDTANTIWNDTSPTSSVFTVGTNVDVNTNNDAIIAYSFNSVKGYSKFGNWIGNSNANGTFFYTGFKPAWLMLKTTASNSSNWQMLDNKRQGLNPENETLNPNNPDAEGTTNTIDFLSNGFKLRTSNAEFNGNGLEYIYMAFAENPFVTSSGVPATAR